MKTNERNSTKKDEFVKPEIEVVLFDSGDVLTTSGEIELPKIDF